MDTKTDAGMGITEKRESGVPFAYPDIRDNDVFLERIFSSGLLPEVYLSDDYDAVLEGYVARYIESVIHSPKVVRQSSVFPSFLKAAAACNGEVMNCLKVGREIGLGFATVTNWYQVLSDTHMGFELCSFTGADCDSTVKKPRYYFSDVGILRTLLGCDTPHKTDLEYEVFFRTYMVNEIRAYLKRSGKAKEYPLTYWENKSGHEVSAVIGDKVAILFKADIFVNYRDLRGLVYFSEESITERQVIVCSEKERCLVDEAFPVYYWKVFLEELWGGKIV